MAWDVWDARTSASNGRASSPGAPDDSAQRQHQRDVRTGQRSAVRDLCMLYRTCALIRQLAHAAISRRPDPIPRGHRLGPQIRAAFDMVQTVHCYYFTAAPPPEVHPFEDRPNTWNTIRPLEPITWASVPLMPRPMHCASPCGADGFRMCENQQEI